MLSKRWLLLPLLLAAACESRGVETRTFTLTNLDPGQAMDMVKAYVPGGTENVLLTTEPPTLTVRAPEVRLEQIEQLLRAHDQPSPMVRLHFQLIEADGFTGTDPAIADVEAALRELFRFSGYRLAAQSVAQGQAGHMTVQQIVMGGIPFTIEAFVKRVYGTDAAQAVELGVELRPAGGRVLLGTALTVPVGQTVVVGSAQADQEGRTLILVVRPQIM